MNLSVISYSKKAYRFHCFHVTHSASDFIIGSIDHLNHRYCYHFQEDADVEWKFGRSQLYMDYISRHSVLPVPLNLLTVPKGIAHVIRDLCGCCACCSRTDEDELDSARLKMRKNGHSNGKVCIYANSAISKRPIITKNV